MRKENDSTRASIDMVVSHGQTRNTCREEKLEHLITSRNRTTKKKKNTHCRHEHCRHWGKRERNIHFVLYRLDPFEEEEEGIAPGG